jgi:hypothetical protein
MSPAAWVGLAIMIGSQAATFARIEPFWSWNTPIAWTGFILFADSVVWKARGNSWLRSNGREFVFLSFASIPLWLVFEGFNQVLRNWYYTGLPEPFALRMFGYAWSFATIWPAIFEGAELIAVLGARRAKSAGKAGNAESAPPAWSVAAGALMLVAPFLVSPGLAQYMAAPVWLGFIFLLDPVNAWLGGDSLLRDLRGGAHHRVKNLALSGLMCGLLWEFWNYWAGAKWHYNVPIMENLKLFEMPLPGYLGFPAFALECFTMYVFVRTLMIHLSRAGTVRPGRTIAL